MAQHSQDLIVSPRATSSELTKKLRAEVANSEAFKAVCHVFSQRERARSQVTIGALTLRMEHAGFHFKRSQYEEVLKSLASLGLGKLDAKGNKVKALRDIRVTLQSIGQVAVGSQDTLDTFNRRNSFVALQVPKTQAKAPPKSDPKYPIAIVATIQGEQVSFPLSFSLTGAQICVLIQNLQTQAALK